MSIGIAAAMKILGLREGYTPNDLRTAKRSMLHALHPDHHPTGQGEIFARLTQDVIEAAELLESRERSPGTDACEQTWLDPGSEQVVFNERVWEDFNRVAAASGTITRYDAAYSSDSSLVVVVQGIDYRHLWFTQAPFTSVATNHEGCALYLLVANRTGKPIDGFGIGRMSYLIDNCGYQYSPAQNVFYWVASPNHEYNQHAEFVAPKCKVEGFVLFPALRVGSTGFARCILKGTALIDGKPISVLHDIKLHSHGRARRNAHQA